MKWFFLIFSIFSLVAAATPARADHHEVFIHSINKLTSTACAVELMIEANSQNGFEGVDRITINGSMLVSLGDTVANDIDTGGHVNVGDSILFASNDFQTQAGLTADVTFDDSACADFGPGDQFAFVIDDPVFGGPNKTIDSVMTDGAFGGNNTAMVKASGSATPVFVDLNTDSVVVGNNAANAQVTLGNSAGGGGNMGNMMGGCSLNTRDTLQTSWSQLSGLILILSAAAALRTLRD